jgi:hypothetical protein
VKTAVLIAALAWAAAVGRAGAALTETAAVVGATQTAETKPVTPAPAVDPSPLGHSGFLYVFSLSNWGVFNASPLGYTPFELGYDFGNGLRVQSGMDLFYYEGLDSEEKNPQFGTRRYTYEMSDWRTSLIYRVPMPIRLRPMLGISLNMVGGSRRLAADLQGGKDINANAPKFAAWSYVGLGMMMGLEYMLSRDWSLQLSERYDVTFGSFPSPYVTQLGVAVTF